MALSQLTYSFWRGLGIRRVTSLASSAFPASAVRHPLPNYAHGITQL